ncbi:CMT1A duplicated region transcript 1 protein [Grus japonensis]|uniref:CMT1A duplicated region transcript 1 protein n=1 Tax=Grus japonensis TaxID=30415 RepID=A0ABC9XJK0_GRUJA
MGGRWGGAAQPGAGGQPPAVCFWPQNTERLLQEGPDAEDVSSVMSVADQDDTVVPVSLQSPSTANQSKDFIRCLPPHLAMYILGFLDQKSLNVCAAVSRCWAFLAKEVKRERVCQSVVQEKILYLQGLCPRGAVPNYAKRVDVTIPQLNEEGDVIEVEGQSWGSKTTEEEDNLLAAYHDLQTDTIQLEERNVFCGSYNIRVLIDQLDRSRIIHYSGGNLVAIGAADRKVRLLGMSRMKEVPPLLSGHAGSIKALFLNEKKGFVLSAGFDLGIREVLSLEFLYLRVISGCADGKIRIFNFLTGSCLKVLMANSRGDPISSFYVAENRMVINSPTSLLTFQFEDVGWDYTLDADREMVRKKNQHKGASSRTALRQTKRCDIGQMHPLALETQDADQLMLSYWIRCRSPKGCGMSQSTTYSL